MKDNSIAYAQHLRILEEEMTRPSVLYQKSLKISKDGDHYCVLMGENLQEGVEGFGTTLLKALHAFDAKIEQNRAKPITYFPSKDVDEYLKKHGHLPNEKCTLAICDEHEDMACEQCKKIR